MFKRLIVYIDTIKQKLWYCKERHRRFIFVIFACCCNFFLGKILVELVNQGQTVKNQVGVGIAPTTIVPH